MGRRNVRRQWLKPEAAEAAGVGKKLSNHLTRPAPPSGVGGGFKRSAHSAVREKKTSFLSDELEPRCWKRSDFDGNLGGIYHPVLRSKPGVKTRRAPERSPRPAVPRSAGERRWPGTNVGVSYADWKFFQDEQARRSA